MTRQKRPRFACLLLLTLLVSACSSLDRRPDRQQPVPIRIAPTELSEAQLLDVWIEVFAPGPVPASPEQARGINQEIREAEARFIPVHLKKTLQQTGHWGAVRVVPEGTIGAELLVTGRILESDGELLKLHVKAIDSSAYQWLDKTYQAVAVASDYATTSRGRKDAFQDLYNSIANDLVRSKQSLSDKARGSIRQLAELQFAASLVPDAFQGYLASSDGRQVIRRLPSRKDPMLVRVAAIRERDYMLIDTVNGHYDAYYRDLWEPYGNWRKFYADESDNLRRVEREAMTRKVLGIGAMVGAIAISMAGGRDTMIRTDSLRNVMIIGGAMLAKSGFDKDQEKQIHIESMQELSASFESESSPMVVEVDGETHRLTGSVEAQYTKWRELLQRIYRSETGLDALQP
jgi:hypothetical protein